MMWQWTLSALYAPVEFFLGIFIWIFLFGIFAVGLGILKALWDAAT